MAGNYRFYNQDEQDALPYKDNYVETGAKSQPLYDESQNPPAEQPQDNFKGYNPKMRDVTNYYQNPVEDYVKPMPEGLTYPAHSLIPKDKLKDPSRPIPYDINPADWKTGDDATDAERNQRKMVRNYTQQLYEEMAKGGDIEQARKEAARNVNLANVGQGLEQMFKSRSVAHGGPGVDSAYWDAQRKGAQLGVDQAEQDRSKKIADYITKKKLGSEAVSEHQQLKDADVKNKMNDPESDISMAYQDAMKGIYPDMFSPKVDPITGDKYDPMDGMSANDLLAASKMLEGKARLDINQQLGLGRLQLDKELGEAKLAQPRGNAKSPEQIKAELANINARTGVAEAQKKKLERETAKPGEGGKPSKAYEAVDRDYAKDYNDWTVSGRADYEKNMQTLEQALEEMNKLEASGKGSAVSGRWEGGKYKVLGDTGRSPEGLSLQKKVEKAVIGTLKAVAGANPTEGERAAVLGTAFNINLPLKENIQNVKSIIGDLNNRALRNEEKARHFEEKGTISGYQGKAVEKMVKIQSPDGDIRPVPESSVEKYLKKGGKVVQ
jgi:hypothetical protein